MMIRSTFRREMKLTKMSAVQETRCKVRILILTKPRDWLQLQMTMNVEMLLTGHSHEVTSVRKAMDNSQVDLVKVDSDLQLNLDQGSTITAADAGSRDQVHDFVKCEAFDELTKILRTNVDKKNISPELQKLVFADLVIDAECLSAFTGKCEWPEDNNNDENKKNVEFSGECGKPDKYSSDSDDSLSHDEQWSMEPVARSVDSATDGSPVNDDPVSAAVAFVASTPTPTECFVIDRGGNNLPTETHSDEKSPDAAVADLEHTLMCVMDVLSNEGNDDPADDDYAPSVTELDYTAPNVKNPSFVGDQQRRLDDVLQKHEAIMISSCNALPPPAYGVVCQLKAGLIAFLDSSWASPIVIVLKKNGQDIRLCIDYKMVNAVTAIMEYVMPLVDDLLTGQEGYLWFGSLDATSGFWVIIMTMRARKTLKVDGSVVLNERNSPKKQLSTNDYPTMTRICPDDDSDQVRSGSTGVVEAGSGATDVNFVDLDDSLAFVAPPTKGSPTTRLDPRLLYPQLPHDYEAFVVTFDGSAKTEKNVWKLPEWQIVIAASFYLEQTTVNTAEYGGMNQEVIAALEYGAEDFVIAGDSRLAIQQSLGVIACRKYSLMTFLNRYRERMANFKSVRYLHVVREYNAATDSLAVKHWSRRSLRYNSKSDQDQEEKVYFEDEVPEGTTTVEATEAAIENLEMQVQRPKAEDEELRWSNPKAILRGEATAMTYKEAREVWKWADNFVPSSDNVLYCTSVGRRKVDGNLPEMSLRLVVPSTTIEEVLHNCHDSIEGGHQGVVRSYQRVKHDCYWIGLYADVEKHVKSCLDCSSSKSLPQLKGYSPGNALTERPFQQERSVKTVMQSVKVYVEDLLQQDWDEIAE
ncbi:hypothetical protein PHMEG_00016502 [Phytophthora megakarya]|uniref:Reverse transcriptase n=1 Tax=Phytophthora megakarya TaxID=4795 RepID=A0A225VZ58_9STRA|nr:hypothetical protein PHMEG_00016502 [Phytophthora megakarya]